MDAQSEPSFGQRMNHTVNLFLWVCGMFALPAVVFFRKDLGRHYMGTQALGTVLVMLLWPGLFGPHDPRPMLMAFYAFLGLCFVARLRVIRRSWRGDRIPRLYNGMPRLMRYAPHCDEVWFKRCVEFPLLVLIGVAGLSLSVPLGAFILTSAACLLITESSIEMALNDHAARMHEQIVEQEILMQKFRQLRGK
jgi:hypothetical protein